MQLFENDESLGQYVADQIANIVRSKPDALISIAAGTSSFPVFDALKKKVHARELSFSEASFFGMDEWCGIPQNADGSMSNFLHKHFLDDVDFLDTFLFDGTANPQSECNRGEDYLSSHGVFDAIVFGVGVNAHIALNEPGVDPSLRTHVATISDITATVARKYFHKKPCNLSSGITIGLANAAEAKAIWIVANTRTKLDAIKKINELTLAGTPSNRTPASLLTVLPQTELLVSSSVFSSAS